MDGSSILAGGSVNAGGAADADFSYLDIGNYAYSSSTGGGSGDYTLAMSGSASAGSTASASFELSESNALVNGSFGASSDDSAGFSYDEVGSYSVSSGSTSSGGSYRMGARASVSSGGFVVANLSATETSGGALGIFEASVSGSAGFKYAEVGSYATPGTSASYKVNATSVASFGAMVSGAFAVTGDSATVTGVALAGFNAQSDSAYNEKGTHYSPTSSSNFTSSDTSHFDASTGSMVAFAVTDSDAGAFGSFNQAENNSQSSTYVEGGTKPSGATFDTTIVDVADSGAAIEGEFAATSGGYSVSGQFNSSSALAGTNHYHESGTIETGHTYELWRDNSYALNDADEGIFSASDTQSSVDGERSQSISSSNSETHSSKSTNNPGFYGSSSNLSLNTSSIEGTYHADRDGRSANGEYHKVEYQQSSYYVNANGSQKNQSSTVKFTSQDNGGQEKLLKDDGTFSSSTDSSGSHSSSEGKAVSWAKGGTFSHRHDDVTASNHTSSNEHTHWGNDENKSTSNYSLIDGDYSSHGPYKSTRNTGGNSSQQEQGTLESGAKYTWNTREGDSSKFSDNGYATEDGGYFSRNGNYSNSYTHSDGGSYEEKGSIKGAYETGTYEEKSSATNANTVTDSAGYERSSYGYWANGDYSTSLTSEGSTSSKYEGTHTESGLTYKFYDKDETETNSSDSDSGKYDEGGGTVDRTGTHTVWDYSYSTSKHDKTEGVRTGTTNSTFQSHSNSSETKNIYDKTQYRPRTSGQGVDWDGTHSREESGTSSGNGSENGTTTSGGINVTFSKSGTSSAYWGVSDSSESHGSSGGTTGSGTFYQWAHRESQSTDDETEIAGTTTTHTVAVSDASSDYSDNKTYSMVEGQWAGTGKSEDKLLEHQHWTKDVTTAPVYCGGAEGGGAAGNRSEHMDWDRTRTFAKTNSYTFVGSQITGDPQETSGGGAPTWTYVGTECGQALMDPGPPDDTPGGPNWSSTSPGSAGGGAGPGGGAAGGGQDRAGKQSVGQPGFWEGLIPVWGSARAAIDDCQNERYGWCIFNGVMAASDVLMVGSLLKAAVKGIGKLGAKLLAREGAEEACRVFCCFTAGHQVVVLESIVESAVSPVGEAWEDSESPICVWNPTWLIVSAAFAGVALAEWRLRGRRKRHVGIDCETNAVDTVLCEEDLAALCLPRAEDLEPWLGQDETARQRVAELIEV